MKKTTVIGTLLFVGWLLILTDDIPWVPTLLPIKAHNDLRGLLCVVTTVFMLNGIIRDVRGRNAFKMWRAGKFAGQAEIVAGQELPQELRQPETAGSAMR
jgi:hypothetical protein